MSFTPPYREISKAHLLSTALLPNQTRHTRFELSDRSVRILHRTLAPNKRSESFRRYLPPVVKYRPRAHLLYRALNTTSTSVQVSYHAINKLYMPAGINYQ